MTRHGVGEANSVFLNLYCRKACLCVQRSRTRLWLPKCIQSSESEPKVKVCRERRSVWFVCPMTSDWRGDGKGVFWCGADWPMPSCHPRACTRSMHDDTSFRCWTGWSLSSLFSIPLLFPFLTRPNFKFCAQRHETPNIQRKLAIITPTHRSLLL